MSFVIAAPEFLADAASKSGVCRFDGQRGQRSGCGPDDRGARRGSR